MTPIRKEFLEVIEKYPDDDTHRLVYADRVEEHPGEADDLDRATAELLRLEFPKGRFVNSPARLRSWFASNWQRLLPVPEVTDPDSRELAARVKVTGDRRVIFSGRTFHPYATSTRAAAFHFERGFLASVTLGKPRFLVWLGNILALHPMPAFNLFPEHGAFTVEWPIESSHEVRFYVYTRPTGPEVFDLLPPAAETNNRYKLYVADPMAAHSPHEAGLKLLAPAMRAAAVKLRTQCGSIS